jgi:hypothetical protein
MHRTELAKHKKHLKTLAVMPTFKALKRKSLPPPFKRMGGPRVKSTGMIKVSDEHKIMMLWRDGETLTDTAFFAYLLCVLQNDDLYTIVEYHWHPSHKDQHIKTPCNTDLDYKNRLLVQAPELSCKPTFKQKPDPRNEQDLESLIVHFCKITGIIIVKPQDEATGINQELW